MWRKLQKLFPADWLQVPVLLRVFVKKLLSKLVQHAAIFSARPVQPFIQQGLFVVRGDRDIGKRPFASPELSRSPADQSLKAPGGNWAFSPTNVCKHFLSQFEFAPTNVCAKLFLNSRSLSRLWHPSKGILAPYIFPDHAFFLPIPRKMYQQGFIVLAVGGEVSAFLVDCCIIHKRGHWSRPSQINCLWSLASFGVNRWNSALGAGQWWLCHFS